MTKIESCRKIFDKFAVAIVYSIFPGLYDSNCAINIYNSTRDVIGNSLLNLKTGLERMI